MQLWLATVAGKRRPAGLTQSATAATVSAAIAGLATVLRQPIATAIGSHSGESLPNLSSIIATCPR